MIIPRWPKYHTHIVLYVNVGMIRFQQGQNHAIVANACCIVECGVSNTVFDVGVGTIL